MVNLITKPNDCVALACMYIIISINQPNNSSVHVERKKKREGEIETNSEDKFEPKPTKKRQRKDRTTPERETADTTIQLQPPQHQVATFFLFERW